LVKYRALGKAGRRRGGPWELRTAYPPGWGDALAATRPARATNVPLVRMRNN
jgi:hypothetical protein